MDVQEFSQPQLGNRVEVKRDGRFFNITSPKVTLASDNPPIEISMEIEKLPTPAPVGTILHGIEIDELSPRYRKMLEEARTIGELPERERPRKLVELLRANVQYAYPSMIKDLEVNNPTLAARVKNIIDVRTETMPPLLLSEIIEAGYGVCFNLSVAMIPLVEAAGLQAALCATRSGVIKNISRKDNGKQLFKLYDLGAASDPHVYIEVLMSNGEWIPTDPSAQLIGDNPNAIETFREAGYMAMAEFIDIDGLPTNVGWIDSNADIELRTGERVHKGILQINAKRIPGISVTPTGELVGFTKETNYEGPLNLKLTTRPTRYSCNASILKVADVN